MNVPQQRSRAAADATTIVRLAGPLLVNNLATAGMGFADTVMAGRLGPRDLAAVAVGSSYVSLFFLAGLGMLMALSPMVAHAYGAGRSEQVGSLFRQALWLSAAISVVVLAALAFVHPVLLFIAIPPEVASLAADYVFAAAFGIPALFAFLALRFSSEGLGWTRPIMFTAITALVANVAGNYVFIYGKLGMPALGAVGCGVATAIADWLIFGILFLYVRRHRVYRLYQPLAHYERPHPALLKQILALAIPIGASIFAEGGLFVSAGLIMGTFGATVMAAHAIAINYATLMFMVPLSLHSATTIHVGHRVGAGDGDAGRFAGWVGITMCTGTMAISALVLCFARTDIAALYTTDETVLALASQLLLLAAAFQVADGLQVGAAGALRGFKDARVPMIFCVVSYWGVGFPLAWYFGVVRGLGAYAVWSGLIVGLFVCAALLSARYRFVTRVKVSDRTTGEDTKRPRVVP